LPQTGTTKYRLGINLAKRKTYFLRESHLALLLHAEIEAEFEVS
jgi:hypothetical protein